MPREAWVCFKQVSGFYSPQAENPLLRRAEELRAQGVPYELAEFGDDSCTVYSLEWHDETLENGLVCSDET